MMLENFEYKTKKESVSLYKENKRIKHFQTKNEKF